ncbi:MAG: 16S rRNA (cytidine(1402)-2'-O)-methyltransferase [Deltaproteobacteria bacterium]|nr:16S rRNA (cytidine(1402)-2'-O)-methyltransferase [Deltaproteobacteria bacterium]
MSLWILATPIGTLSDLSPRAREVLSQAAVIAAEDTRNTRKLLGALGINAPPIEALHAHNEAQRAPALAQRALTEEVVLVSDAGTPALSDPGRLLVEEAHRAGVELRSVPGPSAIAAALAASGFPAAPSTFLGFAPRKGRTGWLEQSLTSPHTLILFEATTRVAELVARAAALTPTREAALCREISKHYEEITRAPLAALAADLGSREAIKGECALVIGPGEVFVPQAQGVEGGTLKDVARVLAERWGTTRKDAYQALLELERDRISGSGHPR